MILGGEIRTVSKLANRGESAVVLLRGPAGSGKTIFAAHLAAHEALVRGGDIIYGCIELLPTELDAQLSGLRFGPEHRSLRVHNLPAGSPAPAETTPRIFAPLIEVPAASDPDFGAEIEHAITEARAAQLRPTVIVIDSLAEGYRLGTTMPRALADALAKFAAEQGMLLILVEETIDARDSAWTFIADVVMELAHHGASGTAAAEQRAVTVRKNRFGPAHVGPHGFVIDQSQGIEIYPRLSTYLSDTSRAFLPREVRGVMPRWKLKRGDVNMEIPGVGEVILVTGGDATLVSNMLERFVSGSSFLRLNMASAPTPGESMGNCLYCGDPVLSAERLLFGFCSKLRELTGSISGVVIGDLEAIDRNVDPDGLRRALPVLIMIARSAGLPIALFETSAMREPLAVHLAETVIRVANRSLAGEVSTIATLSSRSPDQTDVPVEIPYVAR
jgi:KaiC/GvpD/RAD55 family RecA-like ATPase